jgi:RNA-binding protein YlmH
LGGYEGAERNLLLFLPDWMEAEDAETQTPIRCLRASFREEYKLSHRDFLGSLMGIGIVREKIGDILVGPDSADLMVLESVAEFLQQRKNI